MDTYSHPIDGIFDSHMDNSKIQLDLLGSENIIRKRQISELAR